MTQTPESKATFFIDAYVEAIQRSTKISFYLYLWWFLVNLVNSFLGNFIFWDLFKVIPNIIKPLALFNLLLYPLAMGVLDMISRYYSKLSVNDEGITTRSNPFGFWFYQELYALIAIGLPYQHFFTKVLYMRKTHIAAIVIIILFFIINVAQDWELRKKRESIVQEGRLCAYLSLNEWNAQAAFFKSVGILENNRFSKNYFSQSERVKRLENGLICPYWIYINDFDKRNFSKVKIVIYADKSSIMALDKSQRQEILKIVDECIARDEPVLVIHEIKVKLFSGKTTKESSFLQELLKRPIQVISNEDSKQDVLQDFILQDRENAHYTDLILRYRSYLEALEDKDKYRYIKEELTKIDNAMDEVASFYRLVKVVEYIFHYRAIAMLKDGKGRIELINRKRFEASMGIWNDIQNISKKIFREDRVVNSYLLIDRLMNKDAKSKKVVRYQEVCDLLVQLRNRYIGHGTMAFSVSPELLTALMELVLVILEEFAGDGLDIGKEDKLALDVSEEVRCMYISDYESVDFYFRGLICGFMREEKPIIEYLDYNNGMIIATENISYRLSYDID